MTSDEPILFAVPDIDEADVEAVVRVLRSGWITTGHECLALEDELAEYLGVPHVVSTSSCTAALEIALGFLHLQPGARVAVPTWTFASSALSAHREGARVVLCDVEPETLNLSAESVAACLDQGVDAVIGVHFAGVAFSEDVHALCRDAGVPLVEDAAHALGGRDHRGLVNGAGTAGACFSFYATKNLTSGEGGALATDDQELADYARVYRLHGMSKDAWARYHPDAPEGYDVVEPGIKANLPDLLASLARSQFARFQQLQDRRRALVQRYRDNLSLIEGCQLVPHHLPPGSADHLMVVLLPPGTDRVAVRRHLTQAGIGTSVHFQPLHQLTWFQRNAEIAPGGTPVSDAIAPRALSLPLHPRMTLADIDRVTGALSDALRPVPAAV